jgi:hypothetical protein
VVSFPDILISKSRYLSGLRCDKLLWCRYHKKEIFPPHDGVTLARFAQGHEVGRLAHRLFPGGIEVSPESHFAEDVVPLTQELLRKRVPLFEAGFVHGCAYVRVDVLDPVRGRRWDLYEVKSTGSYQPEKHLADVAFQCFVLEGNGLDIRRCYLLHINKEYVRDGDIDPSGLLTAVDITGDVDGFIESVEGDLNRMLEIVKGDQCPEPPITANCWQLGGCDLQPVCWDSLPDHHVLTLVSGKNKGLVLLGMGIESLADVPDNFNLTGRQALQVQALRSGILQADTASVRQFLSNLQYPISFLDFETIGPAIPVYDGTKPFQTIPFQFSLHIVATEDAQPDHYAFLAGGMEDPRPALAEKLEQVLPNSGTILAYNASFERRVLSELAGAIPDHEGWIESALARMADLFAPFRNFAVYHPEQKGSSSMKAVLPALTGQEYDETGISGGEEASMEFLRITFGDVPESDREKVRKQLEEYCRLDTEGMVAILNRLNEVASD